MDRPSKKNTKKYKKQKTKNKKQKTKNKKQKTKKFFLTFLHQYNRLINC